jgi:16S rRNA C967 or C1407 C5-methylase (RsmB/RsmF family)
MEYSITIKELIKRPIIRNDQPTEFLNKMTDNEIEQWEKEVEQELLENGVKRKFPDWNAEFLSKTIDMRIFYKLFKKEYYETK